MKEAEVAQAGMLIESSARHAFATMMLIDSRRDAAASRKSAGHAPDKYERCPSPVLSRRVVDARGRRRELYDGVGGGIHAERLLRGAHEMARQDSRRAAAYAREGAIDLSIPDQLLAHMLGMYTPAIYWPPDY